MRNLSKFQIVMLGIFGGFIVIALIIFSLGRTSSSTPAVDLLVWGTMPKNDFQEMINGVGLDKNETVKINYIEKKPDTYDLDFLEALVSGSAPDIFFLSSDSILKFKERAYVVPFKTYSERDFKNFFAEAGEIFLTEEGIIGFPVLVDPLVMYWNRDILQSNGYVRPPLFWDEIYDMAPRLTIKESGSVLSQSGVALGEYINVANAFEILSALIMQTGNPIVENKQGRVVSVLASQSNQVVAPAESAVSFYTEFSNPLKTFYSWNRALPWSKNHFIAGDLAIYFGQASDLFEIKDKNPNLNFDVASFPQSGEQDKKLTYAKVEALALNKQSRKLPSAYEVAKILSSRNAVLALSTAKSLPPIRRDLLSERVEQDYMDVFYQSAIVSRAWLVPDKIKAGQIFRDMVESVTSGRNRPKEAVTRAGSEIGALLKN